MIYLSTYEINYRSIVLIKNLFSLIKIIYSNYNNYLK